jgi:hypothetical protein
MLGCRQRGCTKPVSVNQGARVRVCQQVREWAACHEPLLLVGTSHPNDSVR